VDDERRRREDDGREPQHREPDQRDDRQDHGTDDEAEDLVVGAGAAMAALIAATIREVASAAVISGAVVV
jgi:hypothetical protein